MNDRIEREVIILITGKNVYLQAVCTVAAVRNEQGSV